MSKTHLERESYKDRSYILFPMFAGFILVCAIFLTVFQGSQKQNARSNAQNSTIDTPQELSPTPTPTLVPTPIPIGQVIMLDINMPGIGSQSGNLTPLHTSREITLQFYSPDLSTSDPSVKPLFTFKSSAEFDSNSNSPTFARFVNNNIDLADKIPDGNYQIVIKANQALPKLVKIKEGDVRGRVIEIRKSFYQHVIISDQTILTGDIFPSPNGDTKLDFNDYVAVENCFGAKADLTSCKNKDSADLNDNGTVDLVDYNIISSNIKTLSEMGFPTPFVSRPQPTLNPKLAAKKSVPEKTVKDASKSSIFIFIIFLIIIVVVFFVVKKFVFKKLGVSDFKHFMEKLQNKKKETESTNVIDQEYYIKKQVYDDVNKRTVLILTDDTGSILGYYNGSAVKEGTARVKGIIKKDGDKDYIEVAKIIDLL